MEEKIEKWFKENWILGLYVPSLVIDILYYVFCYLHIFKDLYINPCVNTFFNILMFILLVIVPMIWFANDFCKSSLNMLFKLFVLVMSFIMLSIGVLLVLFFLFLFNPMTLKDDRIVYNPETGLYNGRSCSLDNDCSYIEYISWFIFLKESRYLDEEFYYEY